MAYPIRSHLVDDPSEEGEALERKPLEKKTKSARLRGRIDRFLERVEKTKLASGTELVDATESEKYREIISHPSIGRRKSSAWVVFGVTDH